MNPIVCASGVELLMDYLEGLLPADVRSALDRIAGSGVAASAPRLIRIQE